MAENRQFPPFDPDDDDESKPRVTRRFNSWEEVARGLGQLLKESRPERYPGKQEIQDSGKAD